MRQQSPSDKPLVSVIVPAYNAETFIGKTLRSILAQSYNRIEVVVVDDGSKDRTAQIVEAIAEKDHRVVLLRQANQGVAAARNLAIRESHGEYIAPIDADDIWYPQKIEKQVECLQTAGPAVGLVYAWSVYIDENDRFTGACVAWAIGGQVYLPLLYSNIVGNASVPLIRRSCFERVGGYSSQLRDGGGEGCEDRDLYLRIAEHYQFGVVPEFLIGYRQVTRSMSRDVSSMAKSHEMIMAEVRRRHPRIPRKLFRWSKSRFCWYLGQQRSRSGDNGVALNWLFKAAWFDPIVLLYKRTYVHIVKNIAALVAAPFGITPRAPWRRDSSGQAMLTGADLERRIGARYPLWREVDARRLAYLTKLGSALIEVKPPAAGGFGTTFPAARGEEEG